MKILIVLIIIVWFQESLFGRKNSVNFFGRKKYLTKKICFYYTQNLNQRLKKSDLQHFYLFTSFLAYAQIGVKYILYTDTFVTKGSCSRSPSINIKLIFQAPLPTMKLSLQNFAFYICSRKKTVFIKTEYIWLGTSGLSIYLDFKNIFSHLFFFTKTKSVKDSLRISSVVPPPAPLSPKKEGTNISRLH